MYKRITDKPTSIFFFYIATYRKISVLNFGGRSIQDINNIFLMYAYII